jgi:hypothetical protein
MIEDDFKASFLIDISVRKGKERLAMLALLDTGYRLSAVIDYQLVKQLYERLQINIVDLAKSILISDFAKEIHQSISQALHLSIYVNKH